MNEIKVRFGVNPAKSHSLYLEFVEAPPPGVSYVTDAVAPPPHAGDNWQRKIGILIWKTELIRILTDQILVETLVTGARGNRTFARFVNGLLGLGFDKYSSEKKPADFDVFHSAGSGMIESIPWIVANDVNWIVDFEHVGSLFGYYGDWHKRMYNAASRRVITKQFSSRYCRKILPWTDAARRTIENILPSDRIAEKTEVMRLAIRPAPPRPNNLPSHDRVRILFMGTSNFQREFWSKGGYEALESYRILRANIGDRVELNFRCWMPYEIRTKYSPLKGLHIIDGVLPREELNRLFWQSDIFLFPSHNTPGLAFLEAMRFGLPIVAKDIWANREIVKNGVNGFLVEPSSGIAYYLPGFVPNWSGDSGPFIQQLKTHDQRVIDDIVDCLHSLVESRNLRERMGSAGLAEVERGSVSIVKRNEQLRRVYEESSRR